MGQRLLKMVGSVAALLTTESSSFSGVNRFMKDMTGIKQLIMFKLLWKYVIPLLSLVSLRSLFSL